jgi:hypothetical protein
MKKSNKKIKTDTSNTKECLGYTKGARFEVTCNGYMEHATPDISVKYCGYMEKTAGVQGLCGISIDISCTAKEAKKLGKLLIKAAKLHKKKGEQFAETL